MITASWLLIAAAIVLAGWALAVFRRPVLAMHVLLDLLLAAGLLRLTANAYWTTIAVTTAVVVLRRVLTLDFATADSTRTGSVHPDVSR
ncbi:MAG: hypothetical protein JHC55_06000 [Mycolicibacterium sp.]|nr:hypothetical protein [Mycolicibacterium sp.]